MRKVILVFFLVSIVAHWLHAEHKSIVLSYNSSDFTYSQTESGGQIQHLGSNNIAYINPPGAPNLPVHLVMVSVPIEAEFSSISFTYNVTDFRNNISISPTQPKLPISVEIDSLYFVPPDPAYYSSNQYPSDPCVYVSTHIMRTYKIFCFQVSPFIYFPTTNQLKLITSGELSLTYSTSYQPDPNRWDDGSRADLVRKLVVNPEDVTNSPLPEPLETDVKYLIITKESWISEDAIQHLDGFGYFQPFIEWKTQKGLKAEIVSVQSINSNYPGTTLQEKIKRCIEYYYLNKRTECVLLYGSPEIVPSPLVRVLMNNYDEFDVDYCFIESDLFYACFDGDYSWNYGVDWYCAHSYGSNVDLLPEVSIGRVAYNTYNANGNINHYLRKSQAYEQTPPSSSFASKALLTGAHLSHPSFPPNPRSDTDWFCEGMWSSYIQPYWTGGSRDRLYDTTSDLGNLTPSSLSSSLASGYNIILESSHGDTQKWAIEWNEQDDSWNSFINGNVPESNGLQNRYGLLYSIACLTNYFGPLTYNGNGPYSWGDGNSDTKSLGTAFLESPGGSVVYIGNTSYGIGNPYWTPESSFDDWGPSWDYAKRFFPHLLTGFHESRSSVGLSFDLSKALMIPAVNQGSNDLETFVMFSLNLQGDPELSILTSDPTAFNVTLPACLFWDELGVQNSMSFSTGVPYARVCISNGAELYKVFKTDSNGNLNCSISPRSPQSLTVTITGRNNYPYIGQIPVVPANIRGSVALNENPGASIYTRVMLCDTSGNTIAETNPNVNGEFVLGVNPGTTQYYIRYELFRPDQGCLYYPIDSDNFCVPDNSTSIELPLVTLSKYQLSSILVSTNPTLPYFKTIGQALLRIQSAVNSSYNGEAIVIKVLPGVYYESVDFNPLTTGQISSLTLKGWGEGAVINAQNTNSCIRIVGNGIGNIVIENLTISNGWSGVQVNLQNCDRLSVVNCEITSCTSSAHYGLGIGSNVPTTITNCTITENQSYDTGQGDDTIGGGLYIVNNTDTPTIVSDCSISNNSANVASAIYMGGSGHFNIRRNRICFNSQGQDSQRYYIAGSVGGAVIENNLFIDRNLSNCIKVQNSGSTTDVVSIRNNTFDRFYACISINSDSSVNIDNNVFQQSIKGILSDSSNNAIQVRNNAFNTTIPFDGITYDPLVHTGCVFTEELNLDNNYIPIWNSEVKSICIDNGNPDTNGDGETWITDHYDRDADGTQMDIGAIPLIDGHIHGHHNLTNDKVKYLSIPGAVNYPGSGEQNSLLYVFHEFRGNGLFRIDDPVLEQITWRYNNDVYSASPWDIPEHYVCSQNGYKVTLTVDAPDMLIQYQGYYPSNILNQGMYIQDLDRYTIEHFITPPEPGAAGCQQDSNTNVWFREIYLGYYLQESLKPFDALLPILDNITTIMAEDWAMARIPIYGYNPSPGDEPADAYTNTWLGCFPTGGREITINPGEMVVVRYIGNEPVEFPLGGDNPDPPFTDPYFREMATHFGYEEKPDYIPIFLSIDLNQFEDGNKPTEIAVFVNEECKGAAVIKEDQVQLNAYITNVEDPSEELANLEFSMYFPNKAANGSVLDYSVLNNQSGRFESRNITVSECKEFLQVRIGKAEEPPLPTVTQLFGNYPNPFNPETTISFDLAEQSNVIIEVFNIKGQKVKTLVRDSYTPGHHSVVWNGTDNNGVSVSSGVYFYKMSTPNHFSTQKMLLLK